jgi:hypothetical protein
MIGLRKALHLYNSSVCFFVLLKNNFEFSINILQKRFRIANFSL